MCGISGIIGLQKGPEELRERITKMTSSLAHRGPDAWGTYVAPGIALGHSRLSIVDLASGHQPMESSDYVISFNGEIYNHIELRNEMKSHGLSFNTRSDTEVVAKAYEFWGEKAFPRFNGQFAVLIWNRKQRRLTVARDRYGVRPLYALYWQGAWYFASEMKAFDTLEGFRRKYDIKHLYQHGLLWNTLGSDTVYKDIRSIESGTIELYSESTDPIIRRYYTLGSVPQPSQFDFKDAQQELINMLRDAVRLRLRSDVPVGVYLSGGIDSSVIALLTSQVMGEQFKSFSVTFEDADFDESRYQQEMVHHLQSDHYSIGINYDTISDNLLEAVYHAERPLFRTAPVPLYMLSKLVRANDIKVVLTGEASDEILYGYDSYKELKLLQFWSRYPSSSMRPLLIKRLYPHLKHYADEQRYGLMKLYYEDFMDTYDNALVGLNIRIKNNAFLAAAFNKEHSVKYNSEELTAKVIQTLPSNYMDWTLLQRNQFLEMTTLLSGYLLSSQGDRMSLGHGVEGRFPFLDYRLVERIFSWPDSFKLSGFSQKHILRRAFRGLLPDSIIDRPKLPYQAPDLRAFMRNGKLVANALHFLTPEVIKDYGIFDDRFVTRFINRFSMRAPDKVGYRDNMTLVFILTAQMAHYWAHNVKKIELDERMRTVDIIETSRTRRSYIGKE